MASPAFVYQEKIDAKEINPDKVCCPRCKGSTLVLYGKYLMACREVQENGIVTDRWTNQDDAAIDLQRIDCLVCSITFVIQEPVVHSLEKQVLELQRELSRLQPGVYARAN